MDSRQLLLSSVQLEDSQFDAFLHRILSRADSFRFAEVADTLSAAEHELFCTRLTDYAGSQIQSLFDDSSDMLRDQNENSRQATCIKRLHRVCEIVSNYVDLPKHRPRALLAVIQSLHDILILIPEDRERPAQQRNKRSITDKPALALKTAIARICEHWWVSGENQAEQLVPQLVPHLLLAALSPGAHESDVKRVRRVQGALALLDWEDASIESIEALLLRCMQNPLFIKSVDGRRFLASLFHLHLGLHAALMRAMKSQLVEYCGGMSRGNSTRQGAAYGDVLYSAWKHAASAPAERESLEECVQSLAHDAIHAAEPAYFKSLRALLSSFHEAKRYKGVDSMLLRSYGPILWRSLRVANAVVRVHATMLFFDSFPLQAEEAPANEADALLQRQFDLLTGLLRDDDHRVRAAAGSGVCRVLREYWEAVPPAITRQALGYVAGTLGRDAACANVRVAALTGLRDLLEQPLAHGTLKGLLPLLSDALHDTNERVRVAFIRILCKVKNVRAMTYYSVAPVDHLLARLAEDARKPAVCQAMTELMLNSFVPKMVVSKQTGTDEGENEGVTVAAARDAELCRRCVEFSRKTPKASCAFYAYMHLHLPLNHVVRFAIALFEYLMLTAGVNPHGAYSFVGLNKGKRRRETDREQDTDAPGNMLRDEPELFLNLLRVLHSLETSIRHKLTLSSSARPREQLQQCLSRERVGSLLTAGVRGLRGSPDGNGYVSEVTSLCLKISAVVADPTIPTTGNNSDLSTARLLVRFDESTTCNEEVDASKLNIHNTDIEGRAAHARAVVESAVAYGDEAILLAALTTAFEQSATQLTTCSGAASATHHLAIKRKGSRKAPTISLPTAIELLAAYALITDPTRLEANVKSLEQLFAYAQSVLTHQLTQPLADSTPRTQRMFTQTLRLWTLFAAMTVPIKDSSDDDGREDQNGEGNGNESNANPYHRVVGNTSTAAVLTLEFVLSWMSQHALPQVRVSALAVGCVTAMLAVLSDLVLLGVSDRDGSSICAQAIAQGVEALHSVVCSKSHDEGLGVVGKEDKLEKNSSSNTVGVLPTLCRLACVIASRRRIAIANHATLSDACNSLEEIYLNTAFTSLARILVSVLNNSGVSTSKLVERTLANVIRHTTCRGVSNFDGALIYTELLELAMAECIPIVGEPEDNFDDHNYEIHSDDDLDSDKDGDMIEMAVEAGGEAIPKVTAEKKNDSAWNRMRLRTETAAVRLLLLQLHSGAAAELINLVCSRLVNEMKMVTNPNYDEEIKIASCYDSKGRGRRHFLCGLLAAAMTSDHVSPMVLHQVRESLRKTVAQLISMETEIQGQATTENIVVGCDIRNSFRKLTQFLTNLEANKET